MLDFPWGREFCGQDGWKLNRWEIEGVKAGFQWGFSHHTLFFFLLFAYPLAALFLWSNFQKNSSLEFTVGLFLVFCLFLCALNHKVFSKWWLNFLKVLYRTILIAQVNKVAFSFGDQYEVLDLCGYRIVWLSWSTSNRLLTDLYLSAKNL